MLFFGVFLAYFVTINCNFALFGVFLAYFVTINSNFALFGVFLRAILEQKQSISGAKLAHDTTAGCLYLFAIGSQIAPNMLSGMRLKLTIRHKKATRHASGFF